MKLLLFLLGAVISGTQLIGQSKNFATVWESSENKSLVGRDILATDSHGYFISGIVLNQRNTNYYYEPFVTHIDQKGKQVWQKVFYQDPPLNKFTFRRIISAGDSSFYLVGQGRRASSDLLGIIVYQLGFKGDSIRAVTLGLDFMDMQLQDAVAYGQKGVLVGGWGLDTNTLMRRGFLSLLDSTGMVQWSYLLGGVNYPDLAIAKITTAKNGSIWISGTLSDSKSLKNMIFMALLDSTGKVIWEGSSDKSSQINILSLQELVQADPSSVVLLSHTVSKTYCQVFDTLLNVTIRTSYNFRSGEGTTGSLPSLYKNSDQNWYLSYGNQGLFGQIAELDSNLNVKVVKGIHTYPIKVLHSSDQSLLILGHGPLSDGTHSGSWPPPAFGLIKDSTLFENCVYKNDSFSVARDTLAITNLSLELISAGKLEQAQVYTDSIHFREITNMCMTIQTGIHNVRENKNVMIWPNPSYSAILVKSDLWGAKEFLIMDVKGQKLIEGAFDPEIPISVNGLSAGMYNIVLTNKKGEQAWGRFSVVK